MQSRNHTPLKELAAIALYGAEEDDEPVDDTPQEGEQDDEQPDEKTYSQDYVDKLRKEAADRRIKGKDANAEVDTLKAEIAKIKQAEMNDLEKAQTLLEEATARNAELEARTVSSEATLKSVTISNAVTLAAVEAGFEDPTDALSMISQDDLVDDEGNISTKTVKARLKALADKKPYLLKSASPGSGDGGQRGKPADEDSFESKQAAYLEEMTATGGRVPA